MHPVSSSVLPSLRSTFRRLAPTSVLAAAVGCAALVSGASAQTVTAPTVITSMPYTITTSGKYVLANNFSYTVGDGPAITISVSNVNLDLGGYFVSGSFNPGSNSPVIRVGDVAGVVIKNGTVANEGRGIEFTGTTDPRDYVVDGVTFANCYQFGVLFDNPAIAGKVYGCKFSVLGGTTQENLTVAILTVGGVRSEKNIIDTLTSSVGAPTVGIYSPSSGNDFAIGNTVVNCNYGIYGGTIYLNNLTTNVTNPFNGTAATGNTSVDANNRSNNNKNK